jgi:hypothetical protein
VGSVVAGGGAPGRSCARVLAVSMSVGSSSSSLSDSSSYIPNQLVPRLGVESWVRGIGMVPCVAAFCCVVGHFGRVVVGVDVLGSVDERTIG